MSRSFRMQSCCLGDVRQEDWMSSEEGHECGVPRRRRRERCRSFGTTSPTRLQAAQPAARHFSLINHSKRGGGWIRGGTKGRRENGRRRDGRGELPYLCQFLEQAGRHPQAACPTARARQRVQTAPLVLQGFCFTKRVLQRCSRACRAAQLPMTARAARGRGLSSACCDAAQRSGHGGQFGRPLACMPPSWLVLPGSITDTDALCRLVSAATHPKKARSHAFAHSLRQRRKKVNGTARARNQHGA